MNTYWTLGLGEKWLVSLISQLDWGIIAGTIVGPPLKFALTDSPITMAPAVDVAPVTILVVTNRGDTVGRSNLSIKLGG